MVEPTVFKNNRLQRVFALCGLFLYLQVTHAEAYIGPGAGFAFLTSFFVLFMTFLAAGAVLLTLPARHLIKKLRTKKPQNPAKSRRVVIIGFDGMDPRLAKRMMSEGKLPNFAGLAESGKFSTLATSYPSISPVAWSNFQTGVGPARHGIFDFLARDAKTYLPKLSSVNITPPSRSVKIGRYRIPLGKPTVSLLRRSRPFWSILGEYGIFSHVLRVPISFPPEKFNGVSLAAMCTPDIIGSQGTFFYFDSSGEKNSAAADSGENPDVIVGAFPEVEKIDGGWSAKIPGPPNSLLDDAPLLDIPFKVYPDAGGARLEMKNKTIELKTGEYTDWITLEYEAAPWAKVRAIGRFLLKQIDDELKLYLTPVQISPEKPAMQISSPFYYSIYLAKRFGLFATLGLAEDTWGLDEGVIDEADFIRQVDIISEEREKMLFDAIEKNSNGLVVCVFDDTDRTQHMFWRYLDDKHEAPKETPDGAGAGAIERVYMNADRVVGRALEKIGKNDSLFVMSDHGFDSFRRCVNLNRWLLDNGYLYLKNNDTSAEWFTDVDWSRTRAYSFGLGGMFINLAGREASGIVKKGEEEKALKKELMEKLTGLKDDDGAEAIGRIIDGAEVFEGPYTESAPDLIIGYNRGWRTSWDAVKGIVGTEVFSANKRRWSGDHAIDPRKAPGILFSNRPFAAKAPSLLDLAPTVLDLFGVNPPPWYEGKSIFREPEKIEEISEKTAAKPDKTTAKPADVKTEKS